MDTRLKRVLGRKTYEWLASGKSITGVKAWLVLDTLREKGYRIIYEDEEVNSRECYIAIVDVNDYFYVLLKMGNRSIGLLVRSWSTELDDLVDIFRKCSSLG